MSVGFLLASLVLVGLLGLVGLWSAPVASAGKKTGGGTGTATPSSFSGQAFVVRATVFGLEPITVSDTGPADPTGGAKEVSLLQVDIPGVFSGNTAHATTFAGTAEFSGTNGRYSVDVSDNGEPGRIDTFTINLFGADNTMLYSASGLLQAENIQLHLPCK
ncbi:MAG: hypothetical protein H0X73_06835 [Chthoniobacterales bacterium]|nr:hypothetical protein [Chthoniobacterales bacterium]